MGLIDSVLWCCGLIALEGHPIGLLERVRKWGPLSLNSPSSYRHLCVSPFFKTRCNKITTAGIINELEWVRREELISYLWDTNQLATSLTVLLMIFSGPQAIPSPSLSLSVPVCRPCSHPSNVLPPLCERPPQSDSGLSSLNMGLRRGGGVEGEDGRWCRPVICAGDLDITGGKRALLGPGSWSAVAPVEQARQITNDSSVIKSNLLL